MGVSDLPPFPGLRSWALTQSSLEKVSCSSDVDCSGTVPHTPAFASTVPGPGVSSLAGTASMHLSPAWTNVRLDDVDAGQCAERCASLDAPPGHNRCSSSRDQSGMKAAVKAASASADKQQQQATAQPSRPIRMSARMVDKCTAAVSVEAHYALPPALLFDLLADPRQHAAIFDSIEVCTGCCVVSVCVCVSVSERESVSVGASAQRGFCAESKANLHVM
jgi:hypothetical protein